MLISTDLFAFRVPLCCRKILILITKRFRMLGCSETLWYLILLYIQTQSVRAFAFIGSSLFRLFEKFIV